MITNQKHPIKWIVTLRAFAAAAVVLIHVVAGWTAGGVMIRGMRWVLDGVILQIAVRWAVPCFVMISGMLLLDPTRDFGIHKTLIGIRRMLIVLATIGFSYCIIETYVSKGSDTTIGTFLISLRNLIEGECWSHMWYVYMLIGLYAFTPMLRCFVKYADEKTFRFTLIVLFVLTILRRTIRELTGIDLTSLRSIEEPWLFYYLIGYYLTKYEKDMSVFYCCGALGIFGFTICLLYARAVGINYDNVTTPSNLFVVLYSVSFIMICKRSERMNKMAENVVVKTISKYSFGIYLFHPIFLNSLNKGLNLFPDILPIFVGEIAFFAVSFCGGLIMSFVLCKVNLIRNILIK